MSRGVHASVVRKPEARLYSGSTCLAGSCDLPTRQSGALLSLQLADASRPEAVAVPVTTSITTTVAEIGEQAVIERITRRLEMPGWVDVGPGDDAAVLKPARGLREVLTTDALVDGVHFDQAFVPADAIGHLRASDQQRREHQRRPP